MRLDLKEERVCFDFPDAKRLFKFDEKDPVSQTFHGAPMKGVDVVAEFPKCQLWIEIKEFTDEDIERMRAEKDHKKTDKTHLKTHLAEYYKYKFRDTFLYRYCEDMIKLPILYICFTNFDDALNLFFKKELKQHLPTGLANPKRWRKELITGDHVFVVNETAWKRILALKFGTCERY